MTASGPASCHPDYTRLTAYLAARDEQQITLTFGEIEQAILLGLLPWAARRQGSWWTNLPNGRRPQHHAWLDAGWRVAVVDRIGETVTFERTDQNRP